jgi:hypothetical protein
VSYKVVISFVLVVVFLYWFVVVRPEAYFWKVATEHPDLAYTFFRSKDCWKIFEGRLPVNYRSIVPKDNWEGPFQISVPKLGHKSIHVFGRYPDFKQSQNEFLSRIK